MEDSTPRPALDLDKMHGSRPRPRKRNVLHFEKKDQRRAAYVVNKFRNIQRKMLNDGDIEDPDPYASSYIFYCFQGVLED